MQRQLIAIQYEERYSQDTLLRKISSQVTFIDPFVIQLIEDMIEVMYSIPHAKGISAIQVGVPLRIFVVNLSRIRGAEIIAINPEITKFFGPSRERAEGCISLSGYKGFVKRREGTVYKYLKINGETCIAKARGYESFVVQHEIDHLNGILYWDYLKNSELSKFE